MHMDLNATEGFRKLNYLLQHPPFPPETLVNLLLLSASVHNFRVFQLFKGMFRVCLGR